MFRTLTRSLLWSALLFLCLAGLRPAAAQMPPNADDSVVLQARDNGAGEGVMVAGDAHRFDRCVGACDLARLGSALDARVALVPGPGLADGGASGWISPGWQAVRAAHPLDL